MSCTSTRGYAANLDVEMFPQAPRGAIVWGSATHADGTTDIHGSMALQDRMLEVEWKIDESLTAILVTREAFGSAELPLRQVRIRAILLGNGTVALAQDFPPLLNSPAPVKMMLLSVVEAKNLFSPLSLSSLPEGQPSCRTASRLVWGDLREREGCRIREGSLDFGGTPMRLVCEKKARDITRLFHGKEGNRTEVVPLYDDAGNTALLLESSIALIDGYTIEFLKCFALTQKSELMAGFEGF